MEISGWGRYPKIDAEVTLPATAVACASALKDPGLLIPRGLGRSYGDSSLAPQVLETNGMQYFQEFDPETGVLACDAGVSLYEILNVFVPQGWFLPVSPGTRFVTPCLIFASIGLFCSISRLTLSGRSAESTTPLTKRR